MRDEIRAMAEGINESVKMVRAQNVLLEKIHSLMGTSRTNSEQLKLLREKLDAVHGTLSAATDSLRLLSVFNGKTAGARIGVREPRF